MAWYRQLRMGDSLSSQLHRPRHSAHVAFLMNRGQGVAAVRAQRHEVTAFCLLIEDATASRAFGCSYPTFTTALHRTQSDVGAECLIDEYIGRFSVN